VVQMWLMEVGVAGVDGQAVAEPDYSTGPDHAPIHDHRMGEGPVLDLQDRQDGVQLWLMEVGVAGVDGLAVAKQGCSTGTDHAPTLDHRMVEDAVLDLQDRQDGV